MALSISVLFLPQIPRSLITGPLIDRFGKKPILTSGSLLCAFVLIGLIFAWSYSVLGTLAFALGLGALAATPAGRAQG